MSRFHSRLFAALIALLALMLGGCANYRLGTGSLPSFKTIYLAPAESEALVPQARALVSGRIREAFLRDGRLSPTVNADEAEAVLTVTLRNFGREASVAKAEDAGLARKFALKLTAVCTLRTRDGKVLFENREVTVTRELYVDGGQLQSEYETLPYLADMLATSLTHAVLDTW